MDVVTMTEAPGFNRGRAFCKAKKTPLTFSDLLVEIVFAHLLQGAALGDGGIEEQHVKAAEIFLDRSHQGLNIGQIAGVAGNGQCFVTQCFPGFGQAFRVAPGNGDVSTFLLKEAGGRQADSAGSARDECGLA